MATSALRLPVLLLLSSCSCNPEKISPFPLGETRLTDDVFLGQTFELRHFDGGYGFVAIWPVLRDGGVALIASPNPARFLKRGVPGGPPGSFNVAEYAPASLSTWFVENTSRGFATVYQKRGGEYRYQASDGTDVPIVQCPVSTASDGVAELRGAVAFFYTDGCQLRCGDRAQWFRYLDGGFVASACSTYSSRIVPLSQDRAEFAINDREEEVTTLRLDGVEEVVIKRTPIPFDSGVYVPNIFEEGRAIIRDGGSAPMWFSLQEGVESARPLPGVGVDDLIEGFAAPPGAPLHTFALVVKERTEGHLSIVAFSDDRSSKTAIQNYAIRHRMIAVGNRYYWVGIRPLPDGGGETWGLTVESP